MAKHILYFSANEKNNKKKSNSQTSSHRPLLTIHSSKVLEACNRCPKLRVLHLGSDMVGGFPLKWVGLPNY